MVEQWETVAHLEAHLQTAHMKAWSDAVKGDVLETHIRILEQGCKPAFPLLSEREISLTCYAYSDFMINRRKEWDF